MFPSATDFSLLVSWWWKTYEHPTSTCEYSRRRRWAVCPHLEVDRVCPKHVAVQRFSHLIDRRLPPASCMVAEGAVLIDTHTQPGYRGKPLALDNWALSEAALRQGWASSVRGSWGWGRRAVGRTAAWRSAMVEAPCGRSAQQSESMRRVLGGSR